MAVFREAEGTSVVIQEIFLLKANPQIRVILDRGACVGRMRGAVRVHDFVQHDITVFAPPVRIQSHRF